MPLKHTVEEISLDNGIKGLLVHVPDATSVRYTVQFRAGNYYVDRPEISQTAHVMEHMSFGPNEKFESLEEFSQEFSRNGAYSNAFTGSIDLVYLAGAALMEWDRILDLQELAISRPKFTEEVLETEKGNVREELIGYDGNHNRIVWQKIMRGVGLDRWYDKDELKTLGNIKLSDIESHFNKTHTLNNMRIVFVGDFSDGRREQVIEKLNKWRLKPGKLLELPKESVRPSDGLVYLKRPEIPNLGFNLYFFLNRILSRREIRAMAVLSYLLTGTMHSRIWGVARKRGICYGMGSWSNRNATGYTEFGIGGQVSYSNAKELFDLVIEQLRSVVDSGVSEDELARAKEYRTGAMQLSTETVASLASWYSDFYFDYGEIDYVDNMYELINGTTAEEIQNLAKEFITSGIWSFGAAGNIEESEIETHYQLFEEAFAEKGGVQ